MLHSSIFRFSTKSCNLRLAKEHLIQEAAKTEERRADSEEPAAAEPVSKAPRLQASTSLRSAFDEILEERQSASATNMTTMNAKDNPR